MKARIVETRERNQKKLEIYWFEPMSNEVLQKCRFFKKNKEIVDRTP